jgi:hypothetical protein
VVRKNDGVVTHRCLLPLLVLMRKCRGRERALCFPLANELPGFYMYFFLLLFIYFGVISFFFYCCNNGASCIEITEADSQ